MSDDKKENQAGTRLNTRAFLLACAAYIIAGLFLFPDWWYSQLGRRGLLGLLYAGIFDYWVLNVIALLVAGIAAVVVAHRPDSSLARMSGHRWAIPIAAAAFFFLATPMLRSGPFGYGLWLGEFGDGRSPNAPRQQEASHHSVLQAPVDLVFLDEAKIEDFYSQFQEELVLSAATQTNSASTEVTGRVGGNDDPLGVGAKAGSQSSESLTYEAAGRSTERKLIDLANFLDRTNQLLVLGPISEVSERYRRFTALSDSLEEGFGLALDAAQASETYRSIVAEEVNGRLDERIAVNGWVLVGGNFGVRATEGHVVLQFAYVPEAPEMVVFETTALPSQGDLAALDPDERWTMRIIGKVLQRQESEGSRRYLIRPYAVFR